jgi:hypothetical protein
LGAAAGNIVVGLLVVAPALRRMWKFVRPMLVDLHKRLRRLEYAAGTASRPPSPATRVDSPSPFPEELPAEVASNHGLELPIIKGRPE